MSISSTNQKQTRAENDKDNRAATDIVPFQNRMLRRFGSSYCYLAITVNLASTVTLGVGVVVRPTIY